jgi:hypothetical protein
MKIAKPQLAQSSGIVTIAIAPKLFPLDLAIFNSKFDSSKIMT